MNRARWLWILAPILGLFGSSCVVTTETCDIDSDSDGWCDDEDDYPLDGACWLAPDPDCDGGPCNDSDGDTVCDEFDDNDCVDDRYNTWTCAVDECDPADNFCGDLWDLWYCADPGTGLQWYYADCNDRCINDPATWQQACDAAALAGSCASDLGACACFCQEAFDSCVNDYTVQYTRAGVTYEVDCKEYCNGSCDAAAGACLCP